MHYILAYTTYKHIYVHANLLILQIKMDIQATYIDKTYAVLMNTYQDFRK